MIRNFVSDSGGAGRCRAEIRSFANFASKPARLLVGAGLTALLAVLPAGCSPSNPSDPGADARALALRQQDTRPNVVMIVTDDLGWGDLAVYGNPKIKTPNIDRLARQGRLFTQFTAASPVCSPSRAAMLTGRYPAELGINTAIGGEGGEQYNTANALDPRLPNLYRAFRAAGYRTGHFGKWHLGGRGAPPPAAYGIDESATTNSSGPRLSQDGAELYESTLDAPGAGAKALPRSSSSEVIVDAAIGFIARNRGRPFLLGVWTLDPHAVLDPTDAQMAPYLGLTHPSVASHLKSAETVYYAAVTNMDRQLGRLFDALGKAGLADNTVVVFTSDNGPAPGGAVATGHAAAGQAGPFRGSKASLYEGGIRVPFIVAWPGHVPAGTLDSSVLNAVDLYPSLLAMIGGQAPPAIDGQDRSPALLAAPAAKPRSGALFWELRLSSWGRPIDHSPRLALREGDWKLLMNPDGSRTELYNLARTPGETADVAAYEPARVAAMRARLMAWYQAKVPAHDKVDPKMGGTGWTWPTASAR